MKGTGGSENGCERRPDLESNSLGVRARLSFAHSLKLPFQVSDPSANWRRTEELHIPQGYEVCYSGEGTPLPHCPLIG